MQAIIRWSLLLVFVLLLHAVPTVFGQGPTDNPHANPITMSSESELGLTASSNNPDTAVEPNGSWLYIDPQATHWYKVTDNRVQLVAWIDANQQPGLVMDIYAPEQHDLYGKPIGKGTPNKIESHDLFWSGKTIAFGTWFIRVTNDSANPIAYSLGYERRATRKADFCAVCHGYGIEFDGCEDKGGSGWCGSLENEYNGK